MGKLRKNHVKRIYKKTYDKSPSVAKILKTVLTTSFKYALRYGYVEEDYVSGAGHADRAGSGRIYTWKK